MFRADIQQLQSEEDAALRRFERKYVTKWLRSLLQVVAAYISSLLFALVVTELALLSGFIYVEALEPAQPEHKSAYVPYAGIGDQKYR